MLGTLLLPLPSFMYEVFFIIYPQVPSFASRDWTQIIGREGKRRERESD